MNSTTKLLNNFTSKLCVALFCFIDKILVTRFQKIEIKCSIYYISMLLVIQTAILNFMLPISSSGIL